MRNKYSTEVKLALFMKNIYLSFGVNTHTHPNVGVIDAGCLSKIPTDLVLIKYKCWEGFQTSTAWCKLLLLV